MAGFNELVVQAGAVGWRASLQIKDGTGVFQCMQTFTPDEARSLGRQLIGAAETADTKQEKKEKEAKAKKSKKKSSKRTTSKASKKRNR